MARRRHSGPSTAQYKLCAIEAESADAVRKMRQIPAHHNSSELFQDLLRNLEYEGSAPLCVTNAFLSTN